METLPPAASAPALPPPPWRIVAAPWTGEPHARGIAAATPLRRGALVDAAPAVRLDAAAYAAVNATPLAHYVFAERGTGGGLVALSAGSLFNHSRRPNVDYRLDGARARILFTAARDVEAGEELTISYGVPWWEEGGEAEGGRGGGEGATHAHMDDADAFLAAVRLGGSDSA